MSILPISPLLILQELPSLISLSTIPLFLLSPHKALTLLQLFLCILSQFLESPLLSALLEGSALLYPDISNFPLSSIPLQVPPEHLSC